MTRRMSAALVTGLGALVLGVGTFAAPQPWQAGAAAPAPQQPQGGVVAVAEVVASRRPMSPVGCTPC